MWKQIPIISLNWCIITINQYQCYCTAMGGKGIYESLFIDPKATQQASCTESMSSNIYERPEKFILWGLQ